MKTITKERFDWNTEQEEDFVFLGTRFDIRTAKRLLTARKRAPQIMSLDVADLKSFMPVEGKNSAMSIVISWDKARSEEIDLNVPLILATLPKSKTMLPIDGWHRIAKAMILGETTLPCVALSIKETKQVMS
jgi:hypothetical protein